MKTYDPDFEVVIPLSLWRRVTAYFIAARGKTLENFAIVNVLGFEVADAMEEGRDELQPEDVLGAMAAMETHGKEFVKKMCDENVDIGPREWMRETPDD